MQNQELIRAIVRDIAGLEEQKDDIAADIRVRVDDAKNAGLDVKAIRAAVKRYRMDTADRAEQDDLFDRACHFCDIADGSWVTEREAA